MADAHGQNSELSLGLVQLAARVGESSANVERALTGIRDAAAAGCKLIVLPEFFNTGYFPIYWEPDYMTLAETADGAAIAQVREEARRSGCHVVATIYELAGPGEYYDTAFLIAPDGTIVGRYRKTHAPARVSLEKIYFRPASTYPVFSVGSWRLGIAICYDTYFPESIRCLGIGGADLVVAPFADVALPLWQELFRVRAFENLLYVAVCNMVGSEGDNRTMDFGGQSLVVDPGGEVLAIGDGSDEGLITATLNRAAVFQARRKRHLWRDRNPAAYGSLVASANGLENTGVTPRERTKFAGRD